MRACLLIVSVAALLGACGGGSGRHSTSPSDRVTGTQGFNTGANDDSGSINTTKGGPEVDAVGSSTGGTGGFDPDGTGTGGDNTGDDSTGGPNTGDDGTGTGDPESCEPGATGCAGECCTAAQTCFDFGCATVLGFCTEDGQCINDSYCQPLAGGDGVCLPYGEGPGALQKLDCDKVVPPGVFFPSVQCEWLAPPPGDAHPNNINVLGTPLVANFGFIGQSTLGGQIVFVSYAGTDGGFPSGSCCGIIRVLDGNDCTQLYSLGGHAVVGGSTPAIGDLDLAPDLRPEIVALAEGGGLVAFRFDEIQGDFTVLWHSTEPDGVTKDTFGVSVGRWNGPVLADIAFDARPEIFFDGVIYDADGVKITAGLGWVGFAQGVFPIVADVDMDGDIEVLIGNRAHTFDEATKTLAVEAYAAATSTGGHIAVADFGAFGVGLPADAAEVVVVSGGAMTITDLTGAAVFGPIALPGGGSGGPPTIADFDGDGQPEVAAAGLGAYTVFDIDCVAPLPDKCKSVGVLWSRVSQDKSSSVTGSSVFDFEGDGTAEAVYGDECFTRVYSGATGEVVSSGPRSSCTWHENPIVADVDGDFRSEIVVGSNTNCSIGCPELDPIFDGLRCDGDDECLAGNCVAGFCRCTKNASCPAGYKCAAMLPATEDGQGSVCRAAHSGKTGGVRVFRDLKDRWVHSRPIWNQHPYSITHVDEFGRIPAKGEVPPNWVTPGLNNFRQNTQGEAAALAAPDLTAKPAGGKAVTCNADGTLSVKVLVCNRGVVTAPPGVSVQVYAGAPDDTSAPVCEAVTDASLAPSGCHTMNCTGSAQGAPPKLWVSVDGKASGTGEYLECVETNNVATLEVTCF